MATTRPPPLSLSTSLYRYWGIRIVLGAALFAATLTAARSSTAIKLQPDTGYALTDNGYADALVDSGHWSINEVSKPSFAASFVPLARLSLGDSLALWVRFHLDARAIHDPMYGLAVPPRTERAELYAPTGKGGFTVVKTGMLVPFDRRPAIGRHNTFAGWVRDTPLFPTVMLPAQAFSGRPLYLHISANCATCGIAWIGPAGWFVTVQDELFPSLIIWGVLIGLGLYHLLLFFALRQRVMLYYALFTFSYTFFELVSDGLAWRYIWPHASVSMKEAVPLIVAVWLASVVIFTRAFLQLGNNLRVLDRTIIGIALATVVTFAARELFRLHDESGALLGTLQLVLYVAILVAVIARWRQGFKPARYFALACGLFAATQIDGLLPDIGLFVGRLPLTDYDQALGALAMAILFALAIADQIRTANRERQESQALVLSNQKAALETLQRYNDAYARFVPTRFLELLGKRDILDVKLGDQVERRMTVLFSDIRSFATLSEGMSPRENIDFINSYLHRAGPIIRKHGGTIDKYIGDAIMALFPESADDALAAGLALQQELVSYNQQRRLEGGEPVAIGIGIHTGDLMLGMVGDAERMDSTVISDAVNIASRLETLTKTYRTGFIISEDTHRSLSDASRHAMRYLGSIEVPGKTSRVAIFEVYDNDPADLVAHKTKTKTHFARAVASFEDGAFAEAAQLFGDIAGANPADGPAAHYLDQCFVRVPQPL